MESKMKKLFTIKNINELTNAQIVDALYSAIEDGTLCVAWDKTEDYCVIAEDEKDANCIETCKIDCTEEDVAKFLYAFGENLTKVAKVDASKICGTYAGEVTIFTKRLVKLIELGAPQILVRNEQINLLVFSFLNQFTLLRDIRNIG